MSDDNSSNLSLTGLEIPFVLAVIALFFWHSPVLLPIKLFTVFFHELSHGLAAILTGGTIESINIGFDQGGVCIFKGGWRLIVASAGYLGSLIWGVSVLLLSLRKGMNRFLTKSIGILLLIVTALWIRNIETLVIVISTAVLLIFMSNKLKEAYCSIFLKFISLVSCFYVVYDIKDDLLDRTVQNSDAYQISKMLFPTFMQAAGSYIIGLLWMGITIFILWKVFNYAFNYGDKK